MIIKTYTKLCFYLYDLLGGQSGTEKLKYKHANISFQILGGNFAPLFIKVDLCATTSLF